MTLSRTKADSEWTAKISEKPRPTFVIQPQRGLDNLEVASLWEYRELLYFLIWRDVKVRYKQSFIGAGWAIIQPAMSMVIFTVIFGNFAKIPSDGFPYAVFAYSALLPWTYFSSALSRSGVGLVNNANLITKVYFPRLIIPLAGVIAPAVDFLFAFLLLIGLMAWYGIAPTWGILALPLFFLLSHDHCVGDRALALAPPCAIPGRGPHDSFLNSVLDVRLAGRVPGEFDPGIVAFDL